MDNILKYDFENKEIENFIYEKIFEFNELIKKIELFIKNEKKYFSIYFVTNETIRNLNREYRKKDEVTDVLSFSLGLENDLNESSFEKIKYNDNKNDNGNKNDENTNNEIINNENIRGENVNNKNINDKNINKKKIMERKGDYKFYIDNYIGEIIFAPYFFINRVKKLNEDVSQFFLYMILHSYLHLLGWDHSDEEKYIKFEKKTEKLLRRINNL